MTTKDDKPSPLRAARMAQGLSLDKLAEKSGISKGALHAAEMHPDKISAKTAAAVAAVLGVPKDSLRTKMTMPAIDVTHAVPWARAEAKKLPEEHPGRSQILETLEALKGQKLSASLGVLGAAPNPEDPSHVGKVLMLALGSPRRQLESGAVLATSPTKTQRQYVLLEHDTGIFVMLELEWRLARGSVEVEVYARPEPEIQ